MAAPGIFMVMVGFQVTVVFPFTLVAVTTVFGVALRRVEGTGVKVAEPVAVASAAMR